jgi:Tol biopolymer transport system component
MNGKRSIASVRMALIAAVAATLLVALPGTARPAGGVAQNIRPTIVFAKEVQTNVGGFISSDTEIYTIDAYNVVTQLTDDPGATDQAPAWSPDGTRIAFAKTGVQDFSISGIYVMDANGLGVTRVTDSLGGDGTPAWSPDGQKLAFASGRDGDYDIWVIDLRTGTQTKLTDNAVNDGNPAWSPDGTRIAFDSFTTGVDRNKEIFLMNADGSGLADLTNTIDCNESDPDWSPVVAQIAFTSGGGCHPNDGVFKLAVNGGGATYVVNGNFPSWSPIDQDIAYMDPAGRLCAGVGSCPTLGGSPDWQPTPTATASNGKIAFASDRTGDLEIYSMSNDGTGQTQLTSSPGDDTQPVWSANGSQIAFASARAGNSVIYRMAAAGGPATAVTDGTGFDLQPTWSPDGRNLAFVSDRAGGFDIYSIDTNGAVLRQLTTAAGRNTDPDWSPDGSKIVFTSDRSGNDNVWVMNADGTNPRQLTTTTARSYGPYWSPDGKWIVFQSERDGNSEIYAMRADGTSQTRLTNDPGVDSSPVWSPDGAKIAFHSNRDGDFEIFVMSASGIGQMPLTGNTALDKFADWQPVVASADIDPPLLTLPANRIVDATSPAGATVTYAVTATDTVDPLPSVSCSPPSGSTFPVGTTTVNCSASDVSGNTSTGSFTVTVLSAKQQLTRLVTQILTASRLPAAVQVQLLAALASFDPSNPAQRRAACLGLQGFSVLVQRLAAAGRIPAAQAADWIAEATRIRAVLGC